MPIFIHVKAESEILSVNELVEESKAVKFLTGIRKNFLYLKVKYSDRFPNAHLVVKTCVNNPELNFK